MSIDVSIRLENLERVRAALDRLSGPQARVAFAAALNDTAKVVKREMGNEMKRVFDRPTKFIYGSPKYIPATADKLSIRIIPTVDARNLPSTGGKVGVDPQHVLQAQEFGGRRADKKSEAVLRRAGILPVGMQTAIPREPFPGSEDGHGNLLGTFVAQLISYLQAYGEEGFRQNMKKGTKENLHRGGTKKQLAEIAGPRMGRRYFVAYGRWRGGRAGNLAPGIWAVQGGSGAIVKPVLMFVKTPRYKPLLNMDRIAKAADVQALLDKKVRYHVRQAAGV